MVDCHFDMLYLTFCTSVCCGLECIGLITFFTGGGRRGGDQNLERKKGGGGNWEPKKLPIKVGPEWILPSQTAKGQIRNNAQGSRH
jgi:hypothetical protein